MYGQKKYIIEHHVPVISSELFCYINGHSVKHIRSGQGQDVNLVYEKIISERIPCDKCEAFEICRIECRAFQQYTEHGKWQATLVAEFFTKGKKAENSRVIV